MTDWQERITQETSPATRAEHAVRYALAAPLIREAELWVDLGSGAGLAAADALGGDAAKRVLLVDVDEDAAKEAARTVPAGDASALRADLADEGELARLRDAIGDASGVITAFEVVEHLSTFIPLVELLNELAERFTVVLSVPNDAFWALENPYHQTMWGEGSFAELRSLLPDGHVVVTQVVLQGSAAVTADDELTAPVRASAAGVPSHYLAVFGPGTERLAPTAAVAQVDLSDQRRWERQRESDLAYLAEINRRLDERNAELERVIAEREDFRRYIHELEDRLGLPRSGSQQAQAALPGGG
jgi:hypothetical protein